MIAVARAAWDFWKTHEYLDRPCRFFLIMETLACPDLTPHKTMRQGRAVSQYEPLAAREISGDWYEVKDHKVQEAGRRTLNKI